MRNRIRSLGTYLPGISLPRLVNLGLYAGSTLLSRSLKAPIVLNRPYTLMVEPVNFCNLRCPMCATGAGELGRPAVNLDPARLEEVIGSFLPSLWLVLLWNQGEPFLHPDLMGLIKSLKRSRITVITSTNGNFRLSDEEWSELAESGLDEIIFSLDGLSESAYLSYRLGGDWALLLGNIERMVSEKVRRGRKRPRVHLQFLALKENQEQIPDFIEFARKLGADKVSLKTVQVFNSVQAKRYLPDNPALSRYGGSPGTGGTAVSLTPPRFCSRLWTGPVLLADGRLTVCCFDRSGRYALLDNGVPAHRSDFWYGGKLGALRGKLLSGEGGLEICHNCTAGLSSPYVWVEELTK